MYCFRRLTESWSWVGGNDRRLAMFEGVYSVPKGVSYNSYLLKDDITVLIDTADKAVEKVFFENLYHELNGAKPDFVIVQHMEPDHSATLQRLLREYPEITVVCNSKSKALIEQFFPGISFNSYIVTEDSVLSTGHHTLRFYMAPMVHWPEVMMTYDTDEKILFSADAFGCFGALNGAVFADEVDFMRDYLDEARRYYCNIVGKYGSQVQSLLKKLSGVEIAMICPAHGFVWRRHLSDYIAKYNAWSTYTPEESGVLIAYASVYGNTENAAELISTRLRQAGIKTEMFDVSVTPSSEIVAAAFKYSHLLFASTTYNAGVFITMDELLRDIAAHSLRNRTVALIENGSWAPVAGKLMRDILSGCKNFNFIGETLTVKSALTSSQEQDIDLLISEIIGSFPEKEETAVESVKTENDPTAFFKLSYGLFVLTAKNGEKDNGCIINTAQQVTAQPEKISITVNKLNFTHDMIIKSGIFNLSVLSENAEFEIYKRFGFASGRDTDKFEGFSGTEAAENGVKYITADTTAYFACKVIQTVDCGTHTLFIADVTEAKTLSDVPSVTYSYYFSHVKPAPAAPSEKSDGKVWICKICGYVYDEKAEGVPFADLPEDWVCPLCKHPKSDFELQK